MSISTTDSSSITGSKITGRNLPRKKGKLPQKIYVACPKHTYDTAYEKLQREKLTLLLSKAFPSIKLKQIYPNNLYNGNGDWLMKWEKTYYSYNALVFYPDGAGYIGMGQYKEIFDCWEIGIPCYYMPANGMQLIRMNSKPTPSGCFDGDSPTTKNNVEFVIPPYSTSQRYRIPVYNSDFNVDGGIVASVLPC